MERKLNGIEEVGVVGGSDGKGFQTGRDEGADGGTRSVNGVRSEPEMDRSGGVKSTPEMKPDGGAQSAPEAKRSGGVKSEPETELGSGLQNALETEPGSEARNWEHGGSADVKREKRKITEGLRGRQPKPLTEPFEKFEKKLWLSSPTMHGPELKYMTEAYESNWMSTVGENIDEVERLTCEKVGCRYAVALSSGTAALHLAVRLAGVRTGDRVFCSDMTFDATVNPVKYEGGEPVFIDTEYDTWNMDPAALEKAFEIYPEVRVVMLAHLYGTPAKMKELQEICHRHGAVLIEDAAESLGATYRGRQTGTFGAYSCISFNGNKIITGSSGGMLLTEDKEAADKVRKWATQARENAPWYQHEELGYNYRMSNVIAGVARGQYPYLEEHIAQKKAIYERYKAGFAGLPVYMNPYDAEHSEPNFWLSCLLIRPEAMCRQVRGDCEALYLSEPGKSCPTEILEALAGCNAEGRPLWKPMHMQPIYRMNGFVTREGAGRAKTNAYISGGATGADGRPLDVGMDLFHRGLCLPSDNKMTAAEQERVIEIVRGCFG